MTRWRVCTLGRTDVLLNPALLLALLYAFAAGHGAFMCVALLSVLLHEATHALTAAAFGQPPETVELTPLGAVMRLDDEGRLSPVRRAAMLLAGPAMTLLLCGAAVHLTARGILPVGPGRMLFVSNLSILMLNLLPVLPLDGGRLLSLLLGAFLPPHAVGKVMRGLGYAAGTALVALNVLIACRQGGWNLSLAFAGCSIIYCAAVSTMTQAMAELRQFMDRKIRLERQGSLTTVGIAALHTQPLRSLVKRLPPGKYALFMCLEAGSMKPMARLTESELIQRYLQQPTQTLGDAAASVAKSAKLGTK